MTTTYSRKHAGEKRRSKRKGSLGLIQFAIFGRARGMFLRGDVLLGHFKACTEVVLLLAHRRGIHFGLLGCATQVIAGRWFLRKVQIVEMACCPAVDPLTSKDAMGGWDLGRLGLQSGPNDVVCGAARKTNFLGTASMKTPSLFQAVHAIHRPDTHRLYKLAVEVLAFP
jgi:hypothetical protein